MKQSLILTWFTTIAVVFIVGCNSPTSNKRLSKRDGELVSKALSMELSRYNCKMDFTETPLAQARVRWDIQRGEENSMVLIEGNHVATILDALRKKFGEPAFVSELDTDGHLSFAFRKDQIGVLLNCGVTIPHPGIGYQWPVTTVGIYNK